MSTWKELYDDMLQELALYQEEVKLNPRQGMRYLTKALMEFQRLTNEAEATKTLTTAGTVTSPTAPYPIGTDVLEIIELIDPNGKTLMPVSYQQYNQIIEKSQTDSGYHETPAMQSYFQKRASASDRTWEFNDASGMMRIYTIWQQNLYRYPAESTDTTLTMRYMPNYEQFSTASTQWQAWNVSDTAFETNFAGTTPPLQLVKWFPAFVSYAVGQYLRSQNVLSGEQPLWQQYDQEFRSYVDQAINLRMTMAHQMQAPYRSSPFN